MAITYVDKIKINKYLKEHAVDKIFYLDMCDALGKRGKINDNEFLEYFTDCVLDEFRSNEKLSIKQLSKFILMINSFLHWVHADGIEINEELLDKIRNLEDFYKEYINRTGFDIDSQLNDDYIGTVLETVDEFYPCEAKKEPSAKYINRIAQLEKQINELKKELSDLTRIYDKLSDEYTEKHDKFDSLNNKVILLERDVKNKDNKIINLNEIKESLNVRINELENSLSKLQEENLVLENYKEQCEMLNIEVTNLKKVIETDIKLKEDALKLKDKQSQIEALIYQKLLFEKVDINEIVKYVKKNGFVSDRNEISNLLRKIKTRINIENNSFSASPTYKIVAPKILEDGTFLLNIPANCKHYDILLVSDFHIEDFDSKVLTGFDMLNDYCTVNDINLILNLGDFYDGFGGKYLDYDNAIRNYKIVEQSITSIPKVDGLYHAILGGNHDRNITKYGFDPIEFLTNEREDFINLGYIHSTIELNKSNVILGKFDIHHPDTFDFPIDIDDNGIDVADIDKYLNSIYKRQERSREDSYIDIFGHTHKSQFNYPGSYCYIPQFFGKKLQRGACHLRIYFDRNTKIKYMVFMPLSVSTKLVKNNEIIYQKKLNK